MPVTLRLYVDVKVNPCIIYAILTQPVFADRGLDEPQIHDDTRNVRHLRRDRTHLAFLRGQGVAVARARRAKTPVHPPRPRPSQAILRVKRFGFPLEEIRQLLDLYDVGDQQQTQYRATMDRARQHLEDLNNQRAELDEAIKDLADQIEWGTRMLASMERDEAAE